MRVDDVTSKAVKARDASIKLGSVSTETKNRALHAMADAIKKSRAEILKANERDVEAARRLQKEGKLSEALVGRLKLDDLKITGVIRGMESVAELDDPVGKTLSAMELDEGLRLYKVSVPLGVVGVVFESRPDVIPQIASLCLKSGNAVILKGGWEASNSNKTLFSILSEASEAVEGISGGWMQLIETREEVKKMLELDEYIDLMIPRGSNDFVRYVQDNTRIPVLGHSEGVCHIYVDRKADLGMAVKVCFDAKVQYPAVCNAIETLLVNEAIADRFLPEIARKYVEAGVELRGDEETKRMLEGFKVKKASEEDWRTEYNDLIISIKIVSGVGEAVEHINEYGSKHTDGIITGDAQTAKYFIKYVDSSSVMHNASTRFSDGFRYGLGAEVGISTNKVHARGPVGLSGLTTYKWVLVGCGHVVADYVGDHPRRYTHKRLDERWSG